MLKMYVKNSGDVHIYIFQSNDIEELYHDGINMEWKDLSLCQNE